jgi:hypothetical protein
MNYIEGFNGTSDNTTIDNYLTRRGHTVYADQTVTTGRFIGVALRSYGARYWSIPVTAAASYTIGFAMKITWWHGVETVRRSFLFLRSDSGANEHITLAFKPDGNLTVITNAETIDTSDLRGKQDNWYYVEFKFTIHNTAGAYELRVNGQTLLNRSGIDTYDAGTVGVDEMRFDYQGSGSYAVDIDDLYISSDFLGDSRVDAIHPDGDGTTNDWTPQGAGSNYVEVDDGDTPDDDTTYVETSTTTDLDLYTYGNLSALGTIHAVQMNVTCRETDANDFNIEQVVRLSGSNYDETPIAIAGQTYETLARVMDEDPNTTSAWTLTAINGAEFGYEATT